MFFIPWNVLYSLECSLFLTLAMTLTVHLESKNMKCVIVSQNRRDETLRKQLTDVLATRGCRAELLEYGAGVAGYQLYQNIVDANPDFIITIDLAGFSLRTDTDEIAFINLNFPSINLITKETERESLDCLRKKLSIAMFFYCEMGGYDYLVKEFPGIPYLKLVESWDEAVDDAMKEM